MTLKKRLRVCIALCHLSSVSCWIYVLGDYRVKKAAITVSSTIWCLFVFIETTMAHSFWFKVITQAQCGMTQKHIHHRQS